MWKDGTYVKFKNVETTIYYSVFTDYFPSEDINSPLSIEKWNPIHIIILSTIERYKEKNKKWIKKKPVFLFNLCKSLSKNPVTAEKLFIVCYSKLVKSQDYFNLSIEDEKRLLLVIHDVSKKCVKLWKC